MKRTIICLAFIVYAYAMNAQNSVGVNTTNPQANLDIRGSQRIGGINNYMQFDTITGRIQWIGSALYAPAFQQIIRHSNLSEGLYAGSGRLEYRNATAPVFSTDWTTGNGYFSGRLGIGNLNPNAPLSFPPALGKKITLYPGATGDVGLAVQGNLFQIYSDNPNADIAFGYDQGGALTERMRIKGNGNVGIGVSDPALRLDISGRMRIRPGSDGDAGIWLNNTANTGFASFMGLQSDNYVGFFGAGVGWAFTMNNQTGALKINGSEGQAGQLIQSNGAGTAPSWASSTNALYNNTFQVTSGTPGVIAVAPGSPAFVPGMSSTFNLVGNAKVMIQFNVAAVTSCTSCWGNVNIVIYCDGNLMRSFGWRIFESSSLTLSASHLLTLPPGSHTISLFAIATSITVNFGSVAGTNPIFQDTMVIQIIPQ